MCYNEIKFKVYFYKERCELAFLKRIKKLKKSVKITGGVIIGLVLVLGIFTFYYRNKWYPNTTVNGINVSSMDYETSLTAIKKGIADYSLEIVGQGNQKLVISGKDIDLAADFEDNLKKDYEQHHDVRNIFGLLSGYDHNIDLNFTYNHDKLNQLINSSVFITGSDDYKITKSTNAYIAYDETTKSGKMVKATIGNELNVEKFTNLIINSINQLTATIDLNDQQKYAEAFMQPVADISDDQLKEMLNTYNNYLLNWISWDMGGGQVETMTPDDIKNWLSCNDKGEVVLDKGNMSKWIEKFCLKYKTVGKQRNFTTHNGNVISISGGDYGWRLDYDKIVSQAEATIVENTDNKLISAYIENPSKKNQKALTTTLEPTYSNKAYQADYENFQNDWDTQNYSEVDLTEQRVYVYRDGQLAYTCICVSGLPNEKNDRITRTGVWYIKEKKPEKVLVGQDYETPVKYWIRIMWTGTGYHALDRSDWANWTPELYKVKGSHGCLNLQEEDAKKLYELIRINDPVFIHY